MTLRRLALYAALLVVLAVAGLALADWALTACAPPPLPGDELWTMRRTLADAITLVFRLGSASCFTADPSAGLALAIGSKTLGLLLVVLAVIVLWETAGRELRRRWFAARGGHVVLAGTHDDLSELARRQSRFAGTFYLAPDRSAAADIARRHPFAEIATVEARRLAGQLTRLGVGKAKLLAAATSSDLTNVAIAEAGLATPGTGELLVRLEQNAVRTLSSHRLRLRAAGQGRALAVVSLTQLQTRRGMAAAMSGRYTLSGEPRVHVALCGSGPTLQTASFGVAQQGFGLESARPLLSILRTGASDFAAGALHRLESAGIAEIDLTDVPGSADGLDRAIGAVVEDGPPLAAVHVIGESGGEAEAMALRWEEVLLLLRQPVPPIVVYGSEDRPLGTTGMIRVATAHNLAEAREAAHLMDQRARAVHQSFLDAQRLARGDQFGTAPAEAEWLHLPEVFQDDNRSVADQMDYKLARVFMLSGPGSGSAAIPADAIETLAVVAHERWWAARALAGWRHGERRDNRLMLHPDMVPFDQLDEPGRQKDRDEVASLPTMAALAGEALRRERRIGIPRPLEADAYARLRDDLRATPKAEVPVAVLPLDDVAMLRLAAALIDDGVLLEAMLDHWGDQLRADPAAGPLLADILRRAWRIHVVPQAEAREMLIERVGACVGETGAIDALV